MFKRFVSVMLTVLLVTSIHLTALAEQAVQADALEAANLANNARFESVLNADLPSEEARMSADVQSSQTARSDTAKGAISSGNEKVGASADKMYKSKRFIVMYKEESGKQQAETKVSKKNKQLKKLKNKKADLLVYSEQVDTTQVQADLQADGVAVDYVQPDFEMNMSSMEENTSSHVIPVSPTQTTQENDWTAFYKDLSEAHKQATGTGVVIALFDSGIDTTHPALQNKLFANDKDTRNGKDDDSNGYIDDLFGWDFVNKDNSVNDTAWAYDQGHGTHVAGILAGESDEVQGIAPGAKVLPLKIFQGGIAYTSDILEAIAYAEAMGAKIANCSWGSNSYNRALYEAIEKSSMLFVCAAGNSTMNLDKYPVYPACFELPNVVSVSSVGPDGRHSRFSNYGSKMVDVAAPGQDIASAWIEGRTETNSGTSQAAAIVAGEAALILGQDNILNAEQIRERILSSSDKITGLCNKVKEGRCIHLSCSVSSDPVNTAEIDIPDPTELPDIAPDEVPQADQYQQYGAENYVTFKTPMLTAREGLGVVALDGKIYAIGGQNGSTYYSTMEIFDPKTNSWTTGKPMNTARSYFGCTVANGKIYIFGGYNGSYLNSVEIYNPTTNTWSYGAVLPAGIKSCTATECDGSIYIIGGFSGSYRNSIYKYVVSNNICTQVGTMTLPRSGHVAWGSGGKIYVEGGTGDGTNWASSGEVLTVASGVATQNGYGTQRAIDGSVATRGSTVYFAGGLLYNNPLRFKLDVSSYALLNGYLYAGRNTDANIARAGIGTAIVDGKMYIIGGRNQQGIYSAVECIELGYEGKVPLPVSIRSFTTTELNGKLYMLGGEVLTSGTWTRSKSIYEYDPLANTWIQKSDMPYYYTQDYAVASAYGKLYIFGGQISTTQSGPYTATKKVFEYDPRTNVCVEKAAMGSAKVNPRAALLSGRIYIVSGNSNAFDVFDPLLNSWEAKASLLETSSTINILFADSKLFAFIGYSIYAYTPETNSWVKKHTTTSQLDYRFMAEIYNNIYMYSNGYATTTYYRYNTQSNLLDSYNSVNDYGTFYNVCGANNRMYIFCGKNGYADYLMEFQPTVNPWVNRATTEIYQAEMGGGVVNNKLYIAGGYASSSQFLDLTKEYDPVTNVWTTKAAMPTARTKAGSAVLDGKLYVIGGETALNTACNTVQAYDPVSNTWATKAGLPYSAHQMAVAVLGGKLYSFGGHNGSSTYSYVYEYNPSTNSWTYKSSSGYAERYGAGAVTVDGKLYLVGGFSNGGAPLNTVTQYDPVSNTWTTKSPMPTASGFFGIAADQHVYIVGGYDGYSTLPMVHEYDPLMDKWSSWPGPEYSLHVLVAAILNDGIYAVGGINNLNRYHSETIFAPKQALYSDIIHFGSDEINPSGNLSRTYTDMTVKAPGFDMVFSRTYNSRDDRTTDNVISRGWTFGFQGKVDSSGNSTIVRLPNGAAMTFKVNADGSYTASDSRSRLVKNGSLYALTTKDQYSYSFNSSGYLTEMKDEKGNAITIAVDSAGRPTSVTDQAGRVFTIGYTSNRISTISDQLGRVVSYFYDASNRLSRVNDPAGNNTYFYYDGEGYLNEVKDHNFYRIEAFTHQPAPGDTLRKLATETSRDGNVVTYTYNIVEGTVQTTDTNSRTTTTWYDKNMYPTRTVNAAGLVSSMEYNLSGGINRWGEPRMVTDVYGNSTYYDRDANGNVTRVVNPDRSIKLYTYDAKNHVLTETDELSNTTTNTYDTSGNLLQVSKQNGQNITSYTYYTSAEATSMCGRPILGLLKTETDPENRTIYYTYNSRGYPATRKDLLSNTETYVYNTLGWLTSKKDALNNETRYYYDKLGNLIKTASPDTGVERLCYDYRGNTVQKIQPKQYVTAYDSAAFSTENILTNAGAYSATTVGWRYEYNDRSQLYKETDPQGNASTYTYDLYGNALTKTVPNNAVYSYEYDKLDRVKGEYFQTSATASKQELMQYSYIDGPGNNGVFTTRCFGAGKYAYSVTISDWRGQLVSKTNPDNGSERYTYYANGLLETSKDPLGNMTYYFYDTLGRMTEKWSPSATGSLYSCTKWQYNKAGDVKFETL